MIIYYNNRNKKLRSDYMKKFTDKNGVSESYTESVYFQVPKEYKTQIEEMLLKVNIPNKTFDHPEKVYFEAKAEVLLRGELHGLMSNVEQDKIFTVSLENREEYGKLLFEEFWSNPILKENEMYKRVVERMQLDNFLKKVNDN
jgi:hypothetical protein